MPVLRELPKLTDLTLASAIGGGGGTGGGGSTVFGLLLAAGLLVSGCSANESTAPTAPGLPAAVTAVTCTVNVSTKAVFCGGPLNTPPVIIPDEVMGGQGVRVVLRSSNIDYTGTDFTFDVTVQNVGAQTLGTDGVSATGVRVFFENDPVVTSGSGVITVEGDSTGTFTAVGQSYYVYADSLPVHATSASASWHFSVPATATTFTFQVLVSSQVPTHGALLRWQPVAGLGRFQYLDVAGSGGNDAMAVGYYGHTKRWNGTNWTSVNGIGNESLKAVTAVSNGVYLAVSDAGKIFKFSGNAWTEVYASPFGTTLNNVWARDTNHWYAVGADATIITYDAGSWTEVRSVGGADLTVINGTTTNAFTGAGAQDGTFLLSTSGGAFTPVASPVPGNFLFAIAWDVAGNFYTSSLNLSTFDGYLIRTGVSVDTLAVGSAVFATDIFPFAHDSLIASMFDLNTSVVQETKYRYGAVPPSSDLPVPAMFNGAFGSATAKLDNAGTKFAAIGSTQDIMVTNGGAWSQVEALGNNAFNASWGRGDSVWVVTGSGLLWKIVGGVATQLTGIFGATDIWGFSGDELYIIADGTVWKGDGVGAWSIEEQIDGGTGTPFRDIWGDPVSGTLIVTAGSLRYVQRVGGVWSEPGPVASPYFLKEVWGCSASQAWMVSVNGQIFDWTPTGVTADPAFTGGPVYAVTGTGCNDVWAAGPNSNLYHWDGASWTQIPIAGDQIFIESLISRDVGSVYVAGEDSKVASVNTTGLTSRMLADNQNDDIFTLWRLDNGDLLVGGQNTVTLGRR